MAKYLIEVVADFLRTDQPKAGHYGEQFRCKVLEDEQSALTTYGMTTEQITILKSRNRETILKAISDEIGAVFDEVVFNPGSIALSYPSGLNFKSVAVFLSNGNNRTIELRGTGFQAPAVAIKQAGNPIASTMIGSRCGADVWQRLYVSAALPAGTYDVTVTSGLASATLQLTVV